MSFAEKKILLKIIKFQNTSFRAKNYPEKTPRGSLVRVRRKKLQYFVMKKVQRKRRFRRRTLHFRLLKHIRGKSFKIRHEGPRRKRVKVKIFFGLKRVKFWARRIKVRRRLRLKVRRRRIVLRVKQKILRFEVVSRK